MPRMTGYIFVIAMVIIAAGFGCSKKKSSDNLVYLPPGTGTGTSTSTAANVSGPIVWDPASTLVYDPKLSDNPLALIAFTPTAVGSFTADVLVKQGANVVRTVLGAGNVTGGVKTTLTWDGRDDGAKIVAPGSYTVEIIAHSSPPASINYPCYVVRLGIVKIAFESPGTSDVEFPLKYNQRTSSTETDFIVSTGGAFTQDVVWQIPELDQTNGAPRPMPAPWTGSADYPENPSATTFNNPAAYLMGSRMQLRVETGDIARMDDGATIGVGYPISNLPIRIRGDYVGYSINAENASDIEGGKQYVVETAAALPATAGKRFEVLQLKFEYKDGGVWQEVPGFQLTTHLIYRTAGIPTDGALAQTEPDGDKCYIKILDLTCQWAEGLSGDANVFWAIWTSMWDFEDPAWVYNHHITNEGFTVAYLIDNHWGRCGAWSMFLLTCMGYHGIEGDQIALFCRNDHIQSMGSGTNTTGRTELEVGDTPGQGWGAVVRFHTFLDHAIIRYNSRYYDPSYIHLTSPSIDGFTTIHSYENYGLEGFWEGIGTVWVVPGSTYRILLPPGSATGTLVPNDPADTEVHAMVYDF
ncbi:MAG: hypothetical protein E3J72_00320 [Planctomycetota bacterium]|nr:MAG: hypothetical protein E3J72_00320 [Planctomycetota bacterium]